MFKVFTTIVFLICFVSNAFAENLNNLFAFHQVNSSKKYDNNLINQVNTTKVTYKVYDKSFFRNINKKDFPNISINSETEKTEDFIENVIGNYTKNIPNWLIVTGGIIAISSTVAVAYSRRNEINNFRNDSIFRNASLRQGLQMNNTVNETPKTSKGRKLSLEFKF
ncbi:MAG: hypothetical protein ACK4IX_11520 [Candidatus Sericytochromatia bacterium]